MFGLSDLAAKVLLGAAGALLLASLGWGGWTQIKLWRTETREAKAMAGEAKALVDLEKCRARVGELERANESLTDGVRAQNASILAAREAAEQAIAAARARAAQAQKRMKDVQAAADSLRGLRAPPAANACDWARDLVDAELRRERGAITPVPASALPSGARVSPGPYPLGHTSPRGGGE